MDKMIMPENRSKFTLAMYKLYAKTKQETGYNASAFLQMLDRHGGEETARRLIHAARQSDGYTKLFMMRPSRLDLTVEAVVVESLEWRELLGEETVKRATKRLSDCGYVPKSPV
jgi:hypothetical protein